MRRCVPMKRLALGLALSSLAGCSCESNANIDAAMRGDAGPPPDSPRPDAYLPAPSASCTMGAMPSGTVQAPQLLATLADRWHEGWLASPSVRDLDLDGTNEIVVARAGLLLGWHLDGSVVLRVEVDGRIWASPLVADFDPTRNGLEVAFAERARVHLVDARGAELPGFPYEWRDELRGIAAGDIDGDGALEIVVTTTQPLNAGGQRDFVLAIETDGSVHPGFPPNTTGAAGCDDACYVTGGYDQNIAVGDITGDARAEIFATQDNAYLSVHEGNGRAFDANAAFRNRTKVLGVRFLHELAEAQQGYAENEETAHQAHFTNSAPAIADLDGDGTRDLVVLGSVQNAAQSDRLRGVGLWAFHPDGTRLANWQSAFHATGYLAGLWDFDGTNIVAATNQVSIADLFPERRGPELVFADFNGHIRAVSADREPLWETTYTTSDHVLTGGVAIGDLSQDGVPEIVFATYGTEMNTGELFVLSATGVILHRIALPGRGSMAVPTLADADGNGSLEISVSLKDGEDRMRSALVFTVPGSAPNCLPWPTGRRDDLRDGLVP